jgi:transcriptional regulator with XRE-family HTH domain
MAPGALLPVRATAARLGSVSDHRPAASVLRQLRQERGASLRSAATDLGIAPSHLSRLERGQKGASSEVAKRAADYYGVDPADLAPQALPADVLRILSDHPEAIEELRARYGPT